MQRPCDRRKHGEHKNLEDQGGQSKENKRRWGDMAGKATREDGVES